MGSRSGKLVAVGMLVLGLAACAPPPRTTVDVISDKFSKEITLLGLEKDASFDDDGVDWKVRSFLDPQAHTAEHQIYVHWFFPSHWTMKYFAADDSARALPTRLVMKESCGRNCGETDTIEIAINEAMLRARAAGGFQLKLSATNGSNLVLDITPQMIAAQLRAEDEILGSASRNAAAASPSPNLNPAKISIPTAPRYSVQDSGLGIGGIPIMGSKIKSSNLVDGLMVSSVQKGSPAELAGVRIGDMMTSFNGHSLTDVVAAPGVYKDAESELIAKGKPGSSVPVEIVRNGRRMRLTIHL